MKNKTLYYLFFLLIISHLSFSQVVWTWQNPTPQGNPMYNIKFVNQNTGYASGDVGYVLKTTDGGANWNFLNTGSTAELRCISIVDNNIIFASGDNNVIQTTNAGLNWTVNSSTQIFHLDNICFVNANTGFGFDISALYKSTNSGANWSAVYEPSLQVRTMEFISPNTGFIADDSHTLKKTTDSGLSWTVVMTAIGSEIISSIHFLDNNTGFAGGSQGNLYKTTDGGDNWSFVSHATTGIRIMSFFDVSNFVVVGYTNGIARTTDGGLNWSYFSDGSAFNVYGIGLAAPNIIFTTDGNGEFRNSSDGGNSWILENHGYFDDINTIYFSNGQTGFAAGSNGRFLKTTNAGDNWNSYSTGFSMNFYAVYFLDNNTGFLSGNGALIKTTNSGVNWFSVYTNPTENIRLLAFLDNNNGYATGSHFILKTTDGGNSWVEKPNPVYPAFIGSVSFANSQTGYMTTSISNILKTTNAGDNWVIITSNTTISDIQFFDENTGYSIAGYQFKKTTDGGTTWNVAFTFTYPTFSPNFSRIKFVNSNTGFISGSVTPHSRGIGFVCKTTDGGSTWTNEIPGTISIPFSIFPVGDAFYFTGSNGTIMKRTENLNSLGNNGNIIPHKFLLYQNYPNPFNPGTMIEYQLPINSIVKLSIFDISGKEVQTLVNEMQSAGTYRASFDGSKLSSGIYFYKLVTERFTETKKMILIK